MDFEEIIRQRKSTRLFSNKELEQEKIEKILEAGRLAPTAKNVQPFKIYVIKSEEGGKMNEIGPHHRWAENIVKRAEVYGVVKSEDSVLGLVLGHKE